MNEQKNLLIVLGEWWQQRQAIRREYRGGHWSGWLPSRGNVLFTLVMIAVLLWAQSAGAVPFRAESAASTGTIAYQGRLADSSGNPLTQTLAMSFRLYSASSGGAPLWTEQWTGSNGVQVSDGLFNVMLGSLTPIPPSVITGNSTLFLGITVGTDDEMSPRVQLGSVPFAVQALTVPDGSITKAKLGADVSFVPPDGSVTTAKIADEAVTLSKLSGTTSWIDLPLVTGYHSPPNPGWQRAQYRRIGDIVYLRGLITIDAGSVSDNTIIANLPANFRPPKNVAFTSEPHNFLTSKHRLDVQPGGELRLAQSAGATPHVDLDGIFFSTSQ